MVSFDKMQWTDSKNLMKKKNIPTSIIIKQKPLTSYFQNFKKNFDNYLKILELRNI